LITDFSQHYSKQYLINRVAYKPKLLRKLTSESTSPHKMSTVGIISNIQKFVKCLLQNKCNS